MIIKNNHIFCNLIKRYAYQYFIVEIQKIQINFRCLYLSKNLK